MSHVEKETTNAIVRLFPDWLRGLVRTMRPKQWTKNVFVLIPIIFDRQLSPERLDSVLRVMVAFGLFCLISSAVYVLNDLVDVERDRLHPKKRFRAIASGQLPIPIARIAAVILPVIALGGALLYSLPLAIVLALYYLKQITYSFYLKNVVILDVLTLAAGFILRVVAGVVVINVTNFSPWLYAVVGALSLFLAVGKRRQEFLLLGDGAKDVRTAFKDYNLPLLDEMMRMVTTGTVVVYTFYTFEANTSFGGPAMLLTVPFALYGMFRYLYLIHVKGEGSAPDEILWKDRPLLLSVILFGMASVAIIYGRAVIERLIG